MGEAINQDVFNNLPEHEKPLFTSEKFTDKLKHAKLKVISGSNVISYLDIDGTATKFGTTPTVNKALSQKGLSKLDPVLNFAGQDGEALFNFFDNMVANSKIAKTIPLGELLQTFQHITGATGKLAGEFLYDGLSNESIREHGKGFEYREGLIDYVELCQKHDNNLDLFLVSAGYEHHVNEVGRQLDVSKDHIINDHWTNHLNKNLALLSFYKTQELRKLFIDINNSDNQFNGSIWDSNAVLILGEDNPRAHNFFDLVATKEQLENAIKIGFSNNNSFDGTDKFDLVLPANASFKVFIQLQELLKQKTP